VESLKQKMAKATANRFKDEAKRLNAEYEQKMQEMKKDMDDDI